MEEVFRVENARYKEYLHVNDLKIYSGKPCFLTGKSGSGKSTFLRLLNATISPDSGDIFYRGESINDCDTISLRKKVMLAGQEFYLFNDTIKNNFRNFYSFRDLPAPPEKEIRKYLEICRADFSPDKNCRTMSGGERQRVFLSVFLSFEPEVLLLDEPTSALDDSTSNLVMSGILDYCIKIGTQVIAVSHNMGVVEKFSARTVEFAGGKA